MIYRYISCQIRKIGGKGSSFRVTAITPCLLRQSDPSVYHVVHWCVEKCTINHGLIVHKWAQYVPEFIYSEIKEEFIANSLRVIYIIQEHFIRFSYKCVAGQICKAKRKKYHKRTILNSTICAYFISESTYQYMNKRSSLLNPSEKIKCNDKQKRSLRTTSQGKGFNYVNINFSFDSAKPPF